MGGKKRDRRRFLKDGLILAGATVGALRSAQGQGQSAGEMAPERRNALRAGDEPSRFVQLKRTMPPETPGYTPLQDLVGVITPNELHFMNTHYNVPELDPAQHRFMIHGMVDHPMIWPLEELKRLPAVSRVH